VRRRRQEIAEDPFEDFSDQAALAPLPPGTCTGHSAWVEQPVPPLGGPAIDTLAIVAAVSSIAPELDDLQLAALANIVDLLPTLNLEQARAGGRVELRVWVDLDSEGGR
jgi:hypothetical protein